MTITHTPTCLGQQKAAEQFMSEHPHACKRCGAAGGLVSPPGRDDPGDYSDCPECVQVGHCPVCGCAIKYNEDDGSWKCTACGIGLPGSGPNPWTPDWQLLPDIDCYCWEVPAAVAYNFDLDLPDDLDAILDGGEHGN